MTPIPGPCPDCGGRMEEGHHVDHGYGGLFHHYWVSGTPQRSWLTGLKLRGRRKVPVATYRCTGCGLLKSYAPDG